MRRSSVTAEEWTRHRKLRKKIASAKWYAHKKQREIEEEHTHRQRLEEELLQTQRRTQGYVWPDSRQRNEWVAVVAHHCLGYPVRPSDQCPLQWRTWYDGIERALVYLRERVKVHWPECGRWLQETFVCKVFRQMAIREHRDPLAFRHCAVPWGCVHPCERGELWTTSVWNWIWVMTHLGNHRVDFPRVWNHIHHHALRTRTHDAGQPDDDWSVLTTSTTLRYWLRWMSQELDDHLRGHPEGCNNPIEFPESEEETDGTPNSPHFDDQGYITQPDTPPIWDWYPDTESDTESLPSSLDPFLNEAFTLLPDGYDEHR